MIPWSTFDRGVFPWPELCGCVLCDMLIDDPRRLRSLCVEQLRREPNQTFRTADIILKEINARLDRMTEWKRHNFSLRYFEVDRDPLEKALVLKKEDDRYYINMKQVVQVECRVESGHEQWGE